MRADVFSMMRHGRRRADGTDARLLAGSGRPESDRPAGRPGREVASSPTRRSALVLGMWWQ